MKYLFFILLFSQLVIAQQQTISLSEVIVNQNDSEKSYRNFRKQLKNNRLYNEVKKAKFSYRADTSEEGIMHLSKLKIDSISIQNSKVKDVLQSVLKVAYTHWFIVDRKTDKNFICNDLGNKIWNFVSYKKEEKVELEATDTLDFNVKISEKGKIEEINSTFFSFDSEYRMKIVFQESKKGVRFHFIEIDITKNSEKIKVEIGF